ncbi:hypothetical protein NC653_019976 [Populus alba x Populus x berolinensis]|uniref:Uncharacterized protein n=1 Tax=Populus alba x Populus x berolinensis TaxID=444605 RepID=A0AAD6QBU1_9ROSI|nr:hypothetical protein NC653_019886 [Populus alba x Populus x berolinensis]KAJ6986612.1 hypothetical protein NC653_019976 [Populus alba x Populus x berolinensis]
MALRHVILLGVVIPFVNKIERGKDWIAGISVTDANWNGNYVEITFSLKFSYEVAKHLIRFPGQQGFSIPIDSNKCSQIFLLVCVNHTVRSWIRDTDTLKEEDFKPNALDTFLTEAKAPGLLINAHDLLATVIGGALLIMHVVGSLTDDMFPPAPEQLGTFCG